MQASIIIPTKNKLSRLCLVLRSLELQVDDSIEVIVVFDGCNQETINGFNSIKLSYNPVQIVNTESLGCGRARNAGIRAAHGKIVIFLDDDRIPDNDFIERHIKRHLQRHFAVIGERLNVKYSEEQLVNFCKNNFIDIGDMKKRSTKESKDSLKKIARKILGQTLDSVTFTTGNSSVERDDLLKAGMFDEAFSGWGMEDVDLGYRLVSNGVKIVRDYNIVNYHLIHPANKSNRKEEYFNNYKYFIQKIHGDIKSIFIAKLLTFFVEF